MGGTRWLDAEAGSSEAAQDAGPAAGAPRPAMAPYTAEQLARLRSALRAGLSPAAPEPAGHAAAPLGEAEVAAAAVAADSLPEHTLYRDEGCSIAPACLRCPLERCIYDRPAHIDPGYRRGRDRRMRTLARRGWEVERLALIFRLSPAHVRRILRPQRAPRRRAQPGSAPP
ncbi:MAG TPA: hypothetical protein VKV26_06545 [Dehalococcoidia bacterium]|nr:hypothetical protein [Dehalococcoidia bacterium]